MKSTKLIGNAFALTMLALTTQTSTAGDSGHPGTSAAGMRYEGAPTAITGEATKDLVTTEGPAMTTEEFARAKKIFFQRCAGCHGVQIGRAHV